MKITIPKYIMGKPIEGSLERVLSANAQNPESNPTQSQNPQPLNVNTDLSKYIKVGINGLNGSSALISPFELESYGGLNYNDSHVKLMENGLYMPTPKIFMTHFTNVLNAFNGNKKLFHADGSEVKKELLQDMYLHLTKNHKDIYGKGNAGAWTWLNAKFVLGTRGDKLDLETTTRIMKSPNGKKVDLIVKREPLEDCLMNDAYVNPSFNGQGLAGSNAKSSKQDYVLGKNIYFWYPRKDNVAGFVAGSGGAVLDCGRDPSYAGSSLGVFGCAEGASAQKI